MIFLSAFVVLILVMQSYFFVADRVNIIDKPNNRSSHSLPTIRGGGIIFLMGLLFWFFSHGLEYPYLVAGAVLIAAISFMDDIREQPAALRLSVHLAAFLLMSWQLGLFFLAPWWLVVVIFIIAIGTLNAFNFMDGINGITGVYTFISLVTLLAIDHWVIDFTNEQLIIILMISVFVFLIYNFRKKARCFAGDVGSVTIAFLLIFLVLQLMLDSGNSGWIVLFALYGIDTVATIVYRLLNKENIFKAHRSHLYQYLANELGYSHLVVSCFYGLVQLAINMLVIIYLPAPTFMQALAIIFGVAMLYTWWRERILARLGKKRLMSYLFKTVKE